MNGLSYTFTGGLWEGLRSKAWGSPQFPHRGGGTVKQFAVNHFTYWSILGGALCCNMFQSHHRTATVLLQYDYT